MGYDENDAAEEAFYDHMYEQFRREHADEIADEITTGEVISAVLVAHRAWWPRVSESLEKGRRRLADREFEEAVFHAGRALDGFVRNVLVTPLTAALVERFERSMPKGFPIKERDIFKSVTGLGNSAAFAEYTVSLVTRDPESTERTIREIRSLVNEGGDKAIWRQRDRVFHSPVAAEETTARDLLRRIGDLLSAFVVEITRLDAAEQKERERREFTPGRVESLHALAALHAKDPQATLRSYEIPLRSYEARNERTEALYVLEALKYIEVVKIDDDGNPSPYTSDLRYRLTEAGRAYYLDRVSPRLPADLVRVADAAAKGSKVQEDIREAPADIGPLRARRHHRTLRDPSRAGHGPVSGAGRSYL